MNRKGNSKEIQHQWWHARYLIESFLIIRRNLKETASFMELQKKDKKSESYSSNNSLGFAFNSEVVKPFNAYINFIQ